MREFVKKMTELKMNERNNGRSGFVIPCMFINEDRSLGLSVQASEFHYCKPKKNIEPGNYERMEFAIRGEENNFIGLNSLSAEGKILSDKLNLDEYFDGSVYSYVEVDKVEEVYKFIKENF